MGDNELHAIEARLNSHLPLTGQRLAGKVGLISGAGSEGTFLGTGAAMALLFAAQGARVSVVDIDRTRAEATCRWIGALGGDCMAVIADIRSSEGCREAIASTTDRYGELDVLVNNAAVTRRGGVEDFTVADWDACFDVNAKGLALLSRAATPKLRDGASIIHLSSIAGRRGHGALAYAASKGAICAMSIDMAYTLGHRGIRVNCLMPGPIHTPVGNARSPEARERRRRSTLLGVEGSCWDVAWAALFLASDESRWITASEIVVDAGATMFGRTGPHT